jgi:diacylglycerol kinase (ATP)
MTLEHPRTDERRIRVLWNPTSGRKGGLPTNRASRTMLLDLMRRHGLGDELVEPGSEREAAEAASDAVDGGYDVVVAAGGDGTFGLVGRQLMGTRTALGILPLGSVMNIPRMLGLSRDVEEAARILADGHLRTIDVGRAGDRIFYETASIGMHAAATRELPKVDAGDYGAIVRSIVAAVRYRPSVVRIDLDGDRTIETKSLLVVVANGPFMGPGLPVAPEASLDDGLFDVRVFLHATKGELAGDLATIASGHRPDERRTLTERARWIRIGSPRPLPVRADAMDLGSTPVEFEIRPGVLHVVAPAALPAHEGGVTRLPGGSAGSRRSRAGDGPARGSRRRTRPPRCPRARRAR